MVVGRTGVNGSLVLKPVVMVANDDCVRVQTHDRLEEELAAQALIIIIIKTLFNEGGTK